MDCHDVRPLISAYMDNDVTPDERRVMQDHVAECAECDALLASYRSLRSTIRALPQPLPPPALRQAVFARATPAYRWRAFLLDFGQQGLAAGALALLVLALVFTFSLLTGRDTPLTPLISPDVVPRVVAVEPGPTVGWAATQPLRITFSTPMDREATQAAVRFLIEGPTAVEDEEYLRATMEWEGDDETLVIGRHGGLRHDTEYRIWVEPALARDREGRRLGTDGPRLIFRTGEPVVAQEATATAAPATPAPPAAPVAQVTPTATPAPPSPSATPVETPAPPPATVPEPAPASTSEEPAATTSQPATSPPPTLAQAPATPMPTPYEEPPPVAPVVPATLPAPAATPVPPPTATPVPPTATTAPTAPTPTATATPRLPFEVTGGFGLLYDGNATVRARLGLPEAAATQAPAATLQFEHGLMYRRGDTKTIYVLFSEQPGVWFSFADTWTDASPAGGGAGPQAGQYIPKRGFGQVWRDADLQQRLGYAVTPNEQQFTGPVQPFQNGLMLWDQARSIHVLYANGTYERHADESR